MTPLIVCCHTGEDLYKSGAERLRKSAEIYGYETYIEEVESRGSWHANCALKPSFILKCAERFNRPLIWIDADGEIMDRMYLFENPYFDFAAPWDPLAKFEWFCSGTLYFDVRKQSVINFLREWEFNCKAEIEGKTFHTDQVILCNTWKECDKIPVTKILPQGYVKVFDHGWRIREDKVEYVRHHQASREIRKLYK
tara:strand:+ start:8150 stop:8737 length:588 start_codon:yes stop_codon:yes gene_type:complete